jgi:hypothetical protein
VDLPPMGEHTTPPNTRTGLNHLTPVPYLISAPAQRCKQLYIYTYEICAALLALLSMKHLLKIYSNEIF